MSMGALLSLAARNVVRNRRRTLITLSGIVLGVAATVFMQGFAGGFIHLMTSLLAESRLGSIQVHRKGFFDEESDPLKLDMPQDAAFEARLAAVPGVMAVSPRAVFEGMLSNGRAGTVVFIAGVDPVREKDVCPHRYDAVKGQTFSPARNEEVLVGRALLEGLEAENGSLLMVTATTQAGATNALDVRVLETLGMTDPLQSKRRVEMTLAHAQLLLGMPGRVTEYALRVSPDADLDDVANALRAGLGPEYEVHTWQELASDLADLVKTMAVIIGVIVLILMLLVLSGIANTMLMAVHERTREIGTMLAMGMRRARIRHMVMVEAALLGILGGVLGALVGWLVTSVVQVTGFPVKPPGSEVDNYLRPVPSLLFAAASAVGCMVGAVLAALHPARRAADLSPVEALRNE